MFDSWPSNLEPIRPLWASGGNERHHGGGIATSLVPLALREPSLGHSSECPRGVAFPTRGSSAIAVRYGLETPTVLSLIFGAFRACVVRRHKGHGLTLAAVALSSDRTSQATTPAFACCRPPD